MKKFIALLICALTLSSAWASKTTAAVVGGAVGYAVGRATTNTTVVNTTPGFFTSDVPYRDIISCWTFDGRTCGGTYCVRYQDQNSDGKGTCTPGQFALQAGYKYLYKRSTLFIEGSRYIVMEVSNIPPGK